MNKLICLAFGFLALAFYVLSGGQSFDPEATRTRLAADATADAAPASTTDTPRVASKLNLVPFDEVAQATSRSPQTTRDTPTPTAGPQLTPGDTANSIAARSDNARQTAPEVIVFPRTTRSASSIPAGDAAIRYVSGDQVILRDGPGTVYGVVAQLPRGTAVTVLESNGAGWVRLRTIDDQVTGWIADFLLRGR